MIAGQVQSFLRHLSEERRLSPRTVAGYAQDLQRFAQFAERQGYTRPGDLNPDAIRGLVAGEHRRGQSSRSIQRLLSAVRGYYQWLQRERLVNANPAQNVRAPKGDKRLPAVLDPDEMATLLDIPSDQPLACRDKAMLELFYSSGLRLSELAGLSWTNLNLDDGMVRVRGKGDRTREVPVGRHAVGALRRWQTLWSELARDAGDAVFISRRGKPMHVRSIQARVRHWAEKKGLWKKVHPHMLRHSFASHVLESSGQLRAVQELLGHADISTTQVYTHLDYQHLARVYDNAHPRAKAKKPD
ncbi:MAG: tyrosine recombinase XerC [Xanthomonadales bacterium]|nr:tyrosine recombinase XerC [Xanthomonadales bacterium]